MKIIFIRHGKPAVPELGKLSASEFHRWIKAYNLASLDTSHRPPDQLQDMAGLCNTIVCSNLRRSIESAEFLNIRKVDCINVIFREVELPCSTIPSPKLSPTIWFVLYRVLWFMGYTSNAESKSAAKRRAVTAANTLHNKALHNDTVLLIGHSIFNHFIARQLQTKGWQGSCSIFSKHWEISEFEYFAS